MKALILNSGVGSRMRDITNTHPKCMTEITSEDTILSRQLRLLEGAGIHDVVITTGPFPEKLMKYCEGLHLNLRYEFVNNPVYDQTNYIYSIYLARDMLREGLLLMHGDLVFEESVLRDILLSETSAMTVSTTLPLPEKDFKAVVENGWIKKVGIEFFERAYAAQPLYFLKKQDWMVWLGEIEEYCERDIRKCYAENAFNEVSEECQIEMLDVGQRLCGEIDTEEDLLLIKKRLEELK